MSKLTFGEYGFEVSNEDKIFFAEEGFTKGEVIEFYQKIAETMLPHLKDRPVTMHRFPDGIEGKNFYQHEASDYFPEWIDRAEIEKKEGGTVTQVICNNTATLVYLANQACLTPHVWLSRVPKFDHPDRLIFDLDPPGKDFDPVRFAANALNEFLSDELNLPVFVMTTGSQGLHVAVPLDGSERFDGVRSFAQSVAEVLAARHPDRLTVKVRKEKRGGRLFLDTARNAYGQTGVAPYALRAQPQAPVATPLRWQELAQTDLHARSYTISNLFLRLGQTDDPWKDIGRHGRSLKQAQQRLKAIQNEEETK